MFVTVTTADIAGEPLENAPIVAEEMDGWLRETPGFEGFMLLAGEGKGVGLAFWESRETAERHSLARTQFRERILSIAGVSIEQVVEYEVVFARLGAGWSEARGESRRNIFVTVLTADVAGLPIDQLLILVDEGEGWLRETRGFEGLILLAGEGNVLGLAFWESRETAERHKFARMQFRERMVSVAGVRVEEVVDYDVAFARLGSGWTEAFVT